MFPSLYPGIKVIVAVNNLVIYKNCGRDESAAFFRRKAALWLFPETHRGICIEKGRRFHAGILFQQTFEWEQTCGIR